MKRITAILAFLAAMSFAAPAQGIIENNLKRHIDYLCSDALEGRLAGSEGERLAATYLYDRLEEMGLTMLSAREGDRFTMINGTDTLRSGNVAAIIEGYDPDLRNEYIVIGANIDHLGSTSVTIDGVSDKLIYRGADANASGVAALIEVARMVQERSFFLRRSVIFVGFGAGERGFAGARYFLQGPLSEAAGIKLMIDLDMLGRGDRINPFRIFTALAQNKVKSLMNYVKDNESVTAMPTIGSGEITPSDYLAFSQNEIPAMVFSTGVSKEFRTWRDTPEYVMTDMLEAESIYIAAFVRCAASKEILFPADEVNGEGKERVYAASECDKRPQFFHSNEQHFLDTWVYKYLKYPQAAVENGIQGKVIVSFIIEKDGSLSDIRIEKGVDELLDDEVIRVISVSPKWIPGQIAKKKVRTRIAIPVEFRLHKN